jgi:hypothetical protein
MHELVDLGHSMMHAVVGVCRDETRTSEHIGISPAQEGWTVVNELPFHGRNAYHIIAHPDECSAGTI